MGDILLTSGINYTSLQLQWVYMHTSIQVHFFACGRQQMSFWHRCHSYIHTVHKEALKCIRGICLCIRTCVPWCTKYMYAYQQDVFLNAPLLKIQIWSNSHVQLKWSSRLESGFYVCVVLWYLCTTCYVACFNFTSHVRISFYIYIYVWSIQPCTPKTSPAASGYRYMASVAGFSTIAMKEFRYLFSADSTRNNYQVKGLFPEPLRWCGFNQSKRTRRLARVPQSQVSGESMEKKLWTGSHCTMLR